MSKHHGQKQVAAIRHVAFEDLGSFESRLAALGFSIRYVEAHSGELETFDFQRPELVVVLGGPIGVYEGETYPCLATELKLLRERADAGRPILGICLGAQLLAEALGGKVHPGQGKEIGWGPLQLTEAGLASPLKHLKQAETAVLHWHGDTFTLPAGARLLASTGQYANQAFAVGDHVLALQFHLEATPAGLEGWFIGHACEISHTPGISVAGLRQETGRHAAAIAEAAGAVLEDWLRQAKVL
jgi:GMP synthase (glutamine-hydrolysing)